MKGRIYISGAFTTVVRSKCKELGELDNDPHFWEPPPSWGICRPDIRETLEKGDFIFFVLPKKAELPQMIYGYMKIKEIITHAEAYHRRELILKRMGNKNPNGNIIVDENGNYNRFDAGSHRDSFAKIRKRYAIGYRTHSEFLSERKIRRLAPQLLPVLNRIFGFDKDSIVGAVSRWGRALSSTQISELLEWLRE
jgi:hypothetical protein